jgi:hypothetical protein
VESDLPVPGVLLAPRLDGNRSELTVGVEADPGVRWQIRLDSLQQRQLFRCARTAETQDLPGQWQNTPTLADTQQEDAPAILDIGTVQYQANLPT